MAQHDMDSAEQESAYLESRTPKFPHVTVELLGTDSNYDDVIGRAAPDAGRRSSHQHPWTLFDRINLAGWLEAVCARFYLGSVSGHGWAITTLAEQNRVRLPDVTP